MNNQFITFIKSLNLSETLAISILAVVLVGVIISEIFSLRDTRIRGLAKHFIVLIFLIEFALILGFLGNNSLSLSYLHGVEIVVVIISLLMAGVMLFRFYDLLKGKLFYSGLLFGAFALGGLIATWLLESTLARIIVIVATNGVFVSLYFLIMQLLMHYQSEKK